MKHIIDITSMQDEVKLIRGYKKKIRAAICSALDYEGFGYKAEISVSLVTKEEIRRLNRLYRKKDKPTDVLSFPMTESDEDFDELDLSRGSARILGDIIICPAVIEKQALEYNTSFEREMCLMTIHSVLHLLGYDHMTEKENAEMTRRQEEILSIYIKNSEQACNKEGIISNE